MRDLHPHHAAVDRVGIPAITARCKVTRQAVFYWRRRGIPNKYHDDMRELGVDLTEFAGASG